MDQGVEAGRGYVLPRSAVQTGKSQPSGSLLSRPAPPPSGRTLDFALCEGRSWKCFKQGSKSFRPTL